MVVLFYRSRLYTLLSAGAAIAPVAVSSLYVVMTRGEGFSVAAFDYACLLILACSSLPIFAILPTSGREKLVLSVASVPVNLFIGLSWTVVLACSAYRNCL